MNTIYLVCTRSAITASALTYIINSSPDCYNLSHNNLWLTEESEWFGTAHIINDWWNVSDYLKNNAYDAEFRNTDALTAQQLIKLNSTWQSMNTGKSICLFTHARNVQEIMQLRDQHQLPIVVITTIMGENSHQFLSGVLRREFNEEMNEYQNLQSAWEHVYNQLTTQDDYWRQHNDVCFKMQDWLIDTTKVYQDLNLATNANIHLWCQQYLMVNDMNEEFEISDGIMFDGQSVEYTIKLFSYLFMRYQDQLNEKYWAPYADKLPETYTSRPKIFDFEEFAAAAMHSAGIPVDICENLV